jgi:hypothetical protein
LFEEWSFTQLLFALIGAAVAVGLVITGLVYGGGSRGTKRYRPGRPFSFTPVWFLSAPEQQARSGATGVAPGRELTTAAGRVARPRETGGASDRW